MSDAPLDLRHSRSGESLIPEHRASAIATRFLDMVHVMARLRRECPWDRQQTAASLTRYVIEEAYEVVGAIEAEDWSGLCEELGDHLLQVLFLAQVMNDLGRFDIADVLDALITKMVHRHPHVFATVEATAAQVETNWEALKRKEKGLGPSLFDGFGTGLPALLESYKIGKKAARVGFDWPDPRQVLAKIEEEIGEVKAELPVAGEEPDPQGALAEELGDLFFALSNLTRKLGLEPEACLRQANAKFIRRFRGMEELATKDGVVFAELDLDAQERYWGRVKENEAKR